MRKNYFYHSVFVILLSAIAFLTGCNCSQQSWKASTKMSVTKADFGTTQEGQKAYLYTLTNANGLVAKRTNSD